jgi:hypothetical protein
MFRALICGLLVVLPLGVGRALAQQSTDPIKTELKINDVRFKADVPIIVDVWVKNQTKKDIERDQFSPLSSSVGLPIFVIVRVPDGKEFSIPPGLYGDDWGQWYEPASKIEAFSVSRFRLPPGDSIHMLHGDLHRTIVRAREHCQRALKNEYSVEEKLLIKQHVDGTKKLYEEIVRFADDFLSGGTFDIYIRAYSKSETIRITVDSNKENSQQPSKATR